MTISTIDTNLLAKINPGRSLLRAEEIVKGKQKLGAIQGSTFQSSFAFHDGKLRKVGSQDSDVANVLFGGGNKIKKITRQGILTSEIAGSIAGVYDRLDGMYAVVAYLLFKFFDLTADQQVAYYALMDILDGLNPEERKALASKIGTIKTGPKNSKASQMFSWSNFDLDKIESVAKARFEIFESNYGYKNAEAKSENKKRDSDDGEIDPSEMLGNGERGKRGKQSKKHANASTPPSAPMTLATAQELESMGKGSAETRAMIRDHADQVATIASAQQNASEPVKPVDPVASETPAVAPVVEPTQPVASATNETTPSAVVSTPETPATESVASVPESTPASADTSKAESTPETVAKTPDPVVETGKAESQVTTPESPKSTVPPRPNAANNPLGPSAKKLPGKESGKTQDKTAESEVKTPESKSVDPVTTVETPKVEPPAAPEPEKTAEPTPSTSESTPTVTPESEASATK
jgi:hypothetical protein